MRRNVMTVLGLGVIALAALMISYPEWRTGPARFAFLIMWAVVAASWIWRLHKAGVLSRTPGEIFNMKERPKTGLLEFLAIMAGIVVTVVTGH